MTGGGNDGAGREAAPPLDDVDDYDDGWRRGDGSENEDEDSEGSDYDYLLRGEKSRAGPGGSGMLPPLAKKGAGAQALYEDVM